MTATRQAPPPARAARRFSGRRLEPVTAIEANSPIESLTVYRALVVCHIAGAVFAVVGWLTTRGATTEALQTPTLVVALVQLVAASWLLRNPVWLPRLLLGYPRLSLVLSIGMTLLYLAPATDPVSPPTTTVAFAWIATTAAVLPIRVWPACGLAMTVLVAAAWAVNGVLEPGVGAAGILIGAAALLPGAVNGAWMGANGNRVARRLRRWGLLIGEEAGALEQLRARAADVRESADRVLAEVAPERPVDAIAIQTLRRAPDLLEGEVVTVTESLRRLTDGLRVPIAVRVDGDEAQVDPVARRAIGDAILRHLTNVHLHAPAARTVEIAVAVDGPFAVITCTDDGAGRIPGDDAEGEGTRLSRGALGAVGGMVGYEQAASGVRLVLTAPRLDAVDVVADELGLVSELRRFVDHSLRNNRLASYASPVPFLLFGSGGVPWWALPLLLFGGLAVELAFRTAGPSAGPSPLGPLVLGATVAVVVTLLFAVGLRGDQPFVCSAATAYPVIELAWRGHWRHWLVFEILRGLAVMPWLLEAGAGGIGGAFVLPVALTLIAVGARRLVLRAEAVESRIGGVIERRRAALDLASHASLRHDVVAQLDRPDPRRSSALSAALKALDEATLRLAAEPVEPARPVDDVVKGVRAAMAPTPVVVEGRIDDERRVGPTLAAPLELEQRLAMLDLGALVGDHLIALRRPEWLRGPSAGAVRVELGRSADGHPLLAFRAGAGADAAHGADAAPFPSIDGHLPGVRVTAVPGGVEVVLAAL